MSDYTRLLSSRYKGLTLKEIVYKYCPPSDQPGGEADTKLYLEQLKARAKEYAGLTVDDNYIPIP